MACLALLAVMSGACARTLPVPRPLDVPFPAYRQAAAAGAVGAVDGRAWQERRRPTDADVPLAGLAVALLPASADFLERLEAIRAGARASAEAYRGAASAIRALRDGYERRLWEAGAADLTRAATVAPDGTFVMADVPAGDWVLVGFRAVHVDRPAPGLGRRERALFAPRTRTVGYDVVSVWVRPVTVAPGGRVRLELTDRNVWFTGVVEERVPDS